MAVIETWFNQDLQKPVKVQYIDGSMFSNNGNGNRIGVNVYDNGEPVTLTGSVSGYAVLSDGTTVPCTGERTNNKASIIVPPAAYVPGALFLSVFLTDGTTVTTLAAVSTSVLLARTDSQVDPGTVVTDWTQTINGAMQDVQTAAANLGQIVATPYASLTYPVPLGKYTYNNGNLYRCVSPIASSENFTPAHWSDAINLGDEVSDLKSALNNDADALCVTEESIATTLNNASSINPATGANGTGIVGCRSGYISYSKPLMIKLDLPDYQCTVWTYTTNSTSNASYSPTGTTFVDGVRTVFLKPITGANPCFRIGLKRYDGQAIPSTDHATILSKISFYTMTDTTLEKSGYPADSKATGDRIGTVSTAESEIRNQMFKYNSVDALYFGNGESRSENGIDFTRNADGTWTLDGTATSTAVSNIINSASAVPDYIVPGKTYTLKYDGTIVPIRFYWYFTDSSRNDHFTVTEDDKDITVPNDIIGLIVRFQISSGTSFSDEVIGVHLLSELSSGGTNIYNITVEPEITTDYHNWLEPSGDTTDMASAIVAMLTSTGYCKLAPGVFYVGGGLDIPSGATLEGCGHDTVVRLLSSVSSGYAIKIKNYATVKDLSISGSSSALTPSGDIGTRHGIVFEAAYGLESGNETSHCMVNNVWIENFTGAGIKCYRTSINYAKGLYVDQAFINRCHTGINIELLSEFNKFVNVCIARCFNACVNNGGNNVFTSCTFHATNIGFLMDDSDGTHGNNGHGTMTACTFCHIGSNTGSAITARNIKNGFSFSACQVWYNSIDLTDCDGFVFSAFEFGKGINTNKGASININGGNTIMFVGCVFMNDAENPPEISITNNTKVKFNNCYGSTSGNAITGS